MASQSRLRALLSFALALAALSGVARLPSAVDAAEPAASTWTPESVGRSGYAQVWGDEFSGTTLDLTKWDPKDVAWPDNNEKQYYSPSAVTVSEGTLKIRASAEPMGGRLYTSGRIDTSQSVQFKHGIYAARLKSTHSQGLWPAWWMFGTGPKYSEIDIFESVGGDSATRVPPTGSGDDSAYGALTHFSVENRPTPNVTHGPGTSFHAPAGQKFSDDWHVMWLEWTGTEVFMGLDGVSKKIIDDISLLDAFDAHMYLILNVAIGGNYPGSPDDSTVLPQNFEVDWVRIFARNGENIMITGAAPPEPGTGTGGGAGSGGAGGASGAATGSNSGNGGGGGAGSSGTNTDGGNTDGGDGSSATNGGGDGGGNSLTPADGAASALQQSSVMILLALIASVVLLF